MEGDKRKPTYGDIAATNSFAACANMGDLKVIVQHMETTNANLIARIQKLEHDMERLYQWRFSTFK